jgi:hypothetical protein
MKWLREFRARRRRFMNYYTTAKETTNTRRYFENSLPILAFLGGLTLTALVVLLQEKPVIYAEENVRVIVWLVQSSAYFEILVAYLGMVSVVSVIGCSLVQRAAAGWVPAGSFSWNMAYWIPNITYVTFLFSLPLMLLPFAPWASLIVLLGGIILGLCLIIIPFLRGDNLWSEPRR